MAMVRGGVLIIEGGEDGVGIFIETNENVFDDDEEESEEEGGEGGEGGEGQFQLVAITSLMDNPFRF